MSFLFLWRTVSILMGQCHQILMVRWVNNSNWVSLKWDGLSFVMSGCSETSSTDCDEVVHWLYYWLCPRGHDSMRSTPLFLSPRVPKWMSGHLPRRCSELSLFFGWTIKEASVGGFNFHPSTSWHLHGCLANTSNAQLVMLLQLLQWKLTQGQLTAP